MLGVYVSGVFAGVRERLREPSTGLGAGLLLDGVFGLAQNGLRDPVSWGNVIAGLFGIFRPEAVA